MYEILQVIGQFLMNSGYLDPSREVFRKSLEVDPKNIQNSSNSINFHLFILSHLALKSGKNEKEVTDEWRQVMKTAVNEIVKLDPHSLQSLLLQALLLRTEKNHRYDSTTIWAYKCKFLIARGDVLYI